jgi:hypothetical protein
MITYKWEVLSLYTKPSLDGLEDVVRRITWRYQITDGGNYGEIYQDTYLPDPTDSNTYIAYANLSEETILGWVQSIEDVPALQAELQLRLEKSKNPDIIENKLPWIFVDRYKPREDRYAMVFNDEVVYGPVYWDSDSMNASLEACGHPRSMPEDILVFRKGIAPYDKPLIVSSALRIYKVNMLNDQPQEHPFYDNGHIVWDLSGDIAVGTYETIPKEFGNVLVNFTNYVTSWVEQMNIAPVKINVNNTDMWFYGQLPNRLELLYHINNMDDTSTYDWKSGDNQWFTANKAKFVEILGILEERQNFIKNWEREKTNLKNQATTSLELIDLFTACNQEMHEWYMANLPENQPQ